MRIPYGPAAVLPKPKGIRTAFVPLGNWEGAVYVRQKSEDLPVKPRKIALREMESVFVVKFPISRREVEGFIFLRERKWLCTRGEEKNWYLVCW